MRKYGVLLTAIGIISIFLINTRTPFFRHQAGNWSVGFQFEDSLPQQLSIDTTKIFSIEKLSQFNDQTVFLADPFFIKEKDTFYLFFEYQMRKSGADIGLMKSVDGVNFVYDTVVLDEKFHLSYPYVFKHKGEFFMLPETKQASNIILYKAHNFPYNWQIEDTLVKNVRLKDPSIFLSDSLNFLITTDDHFNMFMYTSDSLRGSWKKNPKRSLVSFGSEARPGGRVFVDDEQRILLPVQNCSHGYGYGLSLYQLDFDQDKDFSMTLTHKFFLKGQPGIKDFAAGMHHADIQYLNGRYFMVYDGKRIEGTNKEFNWIQPLKITLWDAANFLYQQFN